MQAGSKAGLHRLSLGCLQSVHSWIRHALETLVLSIQIKAESLSGSLVFIIYAIALVPAGEVQHQVAGVIALDRELEGVDRAAPDPFLGIG